MRSREAHGEPAGILVAASWGRTSAPVEKGLPKQPPTLSAAQRERSSFDTRSAQTRDDSERLEGACDQAPENTRKPESTGEKQTDPQMKKAAQTA
jgi:hypothetical protein